VDKELYVFDIECNGFNPDKIWCVGVSQSSSKGVKTTTSYNHMRKLFSNPDVVLVAHNGIRFDKVVLQNLLGIEIKALLVDTLALSWYLHPTRSKHGLASWGEEFGVPKPLVEDWEDQPIEVYLERVEEDVKINTLLWEKFYKELYNMYKNDAAIWQFIEYITFKMECAADQERFKWKLDVDRAQRNYDSLSKERDSKFLELQANMPHVPIKKKRKRPAKPYKKSGDLSAQGVTWFNLLKEHNLPDDYDDEITIIDGYKDPNAGSSSQVKDWLYSLGWVPTTFKFVRDKETNDTREIPQVNNKDGDGVCNSIKKLFVKESRLQLLDGLSVVKHRIGIFKGFLENVDEQGYLKAEIQGLTNTLRFKHKIIVNLPAVDKPYGEEVRGCLMCPDGYELVGSDMAALEDRTKQHYMFPHDPDYVAKMMEEGYCPHVDIAVLAGYLTEEDEVRHKTGEFLNKEDKVYIKAGRKAAKPVNYGGVYGQKPKGLARETGMPLGQAKKLYDIYWERNWSVETIAAEQVVIKANGKRWLKNPVSGFLYSLRTDKDRFSTLNQGTGVYCFDMWVKEVRNSGMPIIGQMHDEIIGLVKLGCRDRVSAIINNAMDNTNNLLQLNRELGCDVQFDTTYAGIH
tara:strand:- start:1220 stop:3103 length:1884 start_codon:yes stop_codon:yes gene_type:complete